MATNVFILEGIMSPYDGSINLGVFTSLDNAIEARKAFVTENGHGSYESYAVYEFPLDQLYAGSVWATPVYEHLPGKTKYKDHRS